MSLIRKLKKETGADEATATYLLEACGNNYEMAVSMYAESRPDHAPTQSGSNTDDAAVAVAAAAAWSDEEDEVRAPIKPKFEVLCPEPGVGFLPQAQQNTVLFRDFQQETRNQEAMMGLGRGVFGGGPSRGGPQQSRRTRGGAAATGSASAEKEAERHSTLRKLEDLFKPPLDLIFKGSFFMAREEGKRLGQWLLVNVQDTQDFACHMVNRDVWPNAGVRKLLQNTFLLWQASLDSEHGRKYMNFYPNVTFPYIAIIDSRTGEHMATFKDNNPKKFCLFLKDFVKSHGRLPNNEEYVKQHETQSSTDATTSTAGTTDATTTSTTTGARAGSSNGLDEVEFINGSSNTKRKRVNSSSDAATSSRLTNGVDGTPPKRMRTCSGGGAELVSAAVGTQDGAVSQALLDITEEDQMKLAIAESLKSLKCVTTDDDTSDDDDGGSVVAIEEFSEDEDIDYSFEEKPDNISSSTEKSPTKPSSTSSSEWMTAKGNLSNGTLLGARSLCTQDSVTPASSISNNTTSPAPKRVRSAASSSTERWRALVADYPTDDNTALVLRLPDGARETLSLPRAAPIKVVLEYLRPRGIQPPGHSALTGWPKKDLFSLPSSTTLKEAGILPRDTIILQEE